MSYTYKKTKGSGGKELTNQILRKEDNAFIPFDPDVSRNLLTLSVLIDILFSYLVSCLCRVSLSNPSEVLLIIFIIIGKWNGKNMSANLF